MTIIVVLISNWDFGRTSWVAYIMLLVWAFVLGISGNKSYNILKILFHVYLLLTWDIQHKSPWQIYMPSKISLFQQYFILHLFTTEIQKTIHIWIHSHVMDMPGPRKWCFSGSTNKLTEQHATTHYGERSIPFQFRLVAWIGEHWKYLYYNILPPVWHSDLSWHPLVSIATLNTWW